VKELTSDIHSQLQTIPDEKIAPIEVISVLIKQHFDFTTDFIAFRDDPDLLDSISTFLATYRTNIHIHTSSLLAKNIFDNFFILSPKQNLYTMNEVIHQWILDLNTITLLQLANSIVCPLSQITNESSKFHRITRTLNINNTTLFDCHGAFDKPLSSLISHTNLWCQFCSEGSCALPILCRLGVAGAMNDESLDRFPVEIGGKSATPPYSISCHVRLGSLYLRNHNIKIFFCSECFN
jgi:hypothetical protein